MLTIKLAKVGKTNNKMFRLVISEKGRDPFGDVLEILGSYNPYSKQLQAKGERILYWISKGAQMTPTVNNLLITNKIVEGGKVKASKKGETSAKRQGQIQAKEAKKQAASEKVEEAATPAPEAEETPAEEPVEAAA